MNDQLDQLNSRLNLRDRRTLINVECHWTSINDDECICLPNMQLQNDNDMRVMFSIFSQYTVNVFIKLDDTLVVYVCDI